MTSTLDNAKDLRQHQTDAEQRLWYHLRAHRFMNLKFKRQKPIGRYIVDFICMEHMLVIELDGGQHATQGRYDEERDLWLREQGYKVMRFWNHDVMQRLDDVVERIRLVVGQPSDETTSHSTKPASGQVAGYPLAPLPLAGEGSEP